MPTDDPPDQPTAAPAGLAALEASIARTEARWQRLLADTYQGTDPARLVTSVVDGQGVVVRVTFAKTIARHDPSVVEEAVLASVAAAQQRLGDALAEVAAEVVPPVPGPAGGPTGADGWRGTGPADGPEPIGGVLGRDDG
ncbi:YbaB/EbfC family nucleoid-associated protein [Plantactinospora sp. CA-294935]|uniref:YbaB/EbfC family nucleoid-associated protein n=1 Tax=Plantactinospora sp. CA-294935 TaxID=3240012 RepID=UPI003D945E07